MNATSRLQIMQNGCYLKELSTLIYLDNRNFSFLEVIIYSKKHYISHKDMFQIHYKSAIQQSIHTVKMLKPNNIDTRLLMNK